MLLPLLFAFAVVSVHSQGVSDYPEGYYPFEEAPGKIPPRVRKPPYLQSTVPCAGTLETPEEARQSLDNLCGDLNDGLLPLNPLGQSLHGASYPFGLIKNKTLDFFSRTLPILKEDKTLPKVAKMRSENVPLRDQFRVIRRPIRSTGSALQGKEKKNEKKKEEEEERKEVEEEEVEGRGLRGREGRSFCDKNLGLLCLLYNTMSGKGDSGGGGSGSGTAQNRDDYNSLNSLRGGGGGGAGGGGGLGGGSAQPLTPCPSAVEYITPVFARNYQGVWRYVVQIPYEGYFTQTVEVTQCLSSQCHYMSGSCLASPRWVSLLVAEVYYPDALFPARAPPPDLSRSAVFNEKPPNFKTGGGFLQRQGAGGSGVGGGVGGAGHQRTTPTPSYCDGQDEIGCFQVRLYYDWFLIPGSCKCWKQDYFASLAYRK
ncbi:uncharacterized protein LOC126981976 [Eriocheir sinensis]|uniref:uncharacterized protein LOC126981976 n=1 Tax=Eriocheir sinensis TaxID=95602 RepID=UPI0021CA99D0|nr:uncharacterized protein LOC126981976 [Eriocheir sinensis]